MRTQSIYSKNNASFALPDNQFEEPQVLPSQKRNVQNGIASMQGFLDETPFYSRRSEARVNDRFLDDPRDFNDVDDMDDEYSFSCGLDEEDEKDPLSGMEEVSFDIPVRRRGRPRKNPALVSPVKKETKIKKH